MGQLLGLVVLNSTPLDSTKIPCLRHRLVGDLSSSSSLRLALRQVLFNGVAQVLAGHQPSEDTADLQVQLLLWAFWDWNQQRAKRSERSCRTAVVDLGWHSQKCCVETGLFAILARPRETEAGVVGRHLKMEWDPSLIRHWHEQAQADVLTVHPCILMHTESGIGSAVWYSLLHVPDARSLDLDAGCDKCNSLMTGSGGNLIAGRRGYESLLDMFNIRQLLQEKVRVLPSINLSRACRKEGKREEEEEDWEWEIGRVQVVEWESE